MGHGGKDDPVFVTALAMKADKGVGYILTIARRIAKGRGKTEPKHSGEITADLCVEVAKLMGVEARDIGLQGPVGE